MRKAVVWLAVLALLGAGGYAIWYTQGQPPLWAWFGGTPDADGRAAQAEKTPQAADARATVEAVKVTVGPISREISAIGSVRSDEAVIIRPEIPGRVAKILFDEGQRVTRGQPLIRLDGTILAAQFEQAKANLALSQANSERAQKLYRQGAGTERARDEASAKLRVDQAAMEVSRAALEKTEIAAPFDGIVGLRRVSVGAYVTAGEDIVNLEKIDAVKLDFRVPETYLRAVRVGQTLTITVDAYPDRTFSGEIYAIDPLVDQTGRSIVIRARVPNEDLILRPGLFARIKLEVERVTNAILVPEEAIVPRGDQTLIYKVVGDGFEEVPVKLGLRRGTQVEVVSGLSPEDVVITGGQLKLRPGTKIDIVSAKADGASTLRQGA